jgi:hypothetical protein
MLKPIVCLIECTISAITWCAGPGWTQTIGDEAELERLRVKAEDAMASDDPEGAAMAMGRAAMMAKRLSLVNRNDGTSARLYQGAESLFRSQEHGYRAMALFRRAGGQLPASSGVCGSLALAQGSVQHALSDLARRGLSAGGIDGAGEALARDRGRLDHGRGGHDRRLPMSVTANPPRD